LTPEQVCRVFLISWDLFSAKGIEESVKITTPARPLDVAMIQYALILATSSTRLVSLVKSRGLALGPGDRVACQPTSGMPASPAFLTC
jgi:hypothetical protein